MESELLNVGATNLTVPYREIDRLAEVSLTFRTSMALIYFLTAIVAFVANLFAILLLVYGPRRSRQLNQFLANLGASDILFAICNIPFTYITLVYNTWWLPEFLCPLSSFVQVLAPTVAFYTLIAIGIGRYFVIVTGHELLFLTKSRHTKIAICLIWIFAILLAAPILFVSKISPVVFENVHYVECSEDWSTLEALWPLRESANPSTILDTVVGVTPHTSGSGDGIENFAEFILTTSTTSLPPTVETFVSSTPTILSTESVGQEPQRIGQLYTIVVFVLTFILPVVTLTYLYGHIGLIVYKHQLPFGNDSHITNQNLTQTKIKVVKMLLILVISFIICWSPAQIFYLMLWVFEDIRQDTELGSSSPTLASATGSAMPVMDTTGATPSSFLSSTVSSNVFLSASADTTPPPPPPLGSTSGSSWYSVLYYTMYFSFHWLSCAHTIINPFVYCFFSNNFQKNDLIAILLCRGSSHDRNKRRSVNLGHSSAAFARNNSLNNNNNNSQNHPNPNNAQKQRPNSNRARSTVNATVQKQPSFGTGGTGNGHVVQRYNTGNGAHRIKHQQQVNAGGGGVGGVSVGSGAAGGVVSGLRLANDCVVTIRDHSLTDQPYNDV